MNYLIRNDLTGRFWHADKSEARLYAIGGILDQWYSVFSLNGGTLPLCKFEV